VRRIILVLALLIFSVGLANASYMDLFKDGRITKAELTNAVLNYMLHKSNLSFEDVCDASYVYIYWHGKPKTIVDSANDTITIYRPVKRIVALSVDSAEALAILGAKNEVVGVSKYVKEEKRHFPVLSKLPSVGSCFSPNVEAIVELHPDIVITYVKWPDKSELEDKIKLVDPSIKVVRLDFYKASTLREEMEKLGYLLDKEENATKYVKWFDKWLNFVKSRIPEEKVKVYTCGKPLKAFGEGTGLYDLTVMAGGDNVLKGKKGYFDVDPEQVVLWAPQVIVSWCYAKGYSPEAKEIMKERFLQIVEFPGWEDVPAVKDGRVYVISSDIGSSPALPVGLVTVAKWLYPEKFKDVDPKEVMQEYVSEFLHLKFNVSEGCFAYPTW